MINSVKYQRVSSQVSKFIQYLSLKLVLFSIVLKLSLTLSFALIPTLFPLFSHPFLIIF